MARIVLPSVNEGSAAYLSPTFLNKTNQPDVPTSITYKVVCLTTGTLMRDWTAIATPLSTVEITLDSITDNIINTQTNSKETRCVTVKAVYGPSDELIDEYEYDVINLNGV